MRANHVASGKAKKWVIPFFFTLAIGALCLRVIGEVHKRESLRVAAVHIYNFIESNNSGYAFDSMLPIERELGQVDSETFSKFLSWYNAQMNGVKYSSIVMTGNQSNAIANHRYQDGVSSGGSGIELAVTPDGPKALMISDLLETAIARRNLKSNSSQELMSAWAKGRLDGFLKERPVLEKMGLKGYVTGMPHPVFVTWDRHEAMLRKMIEVKLQQEAEANKLLGQFGQNPEGNQPSP